MILQERGQLLIQDPIGDYISEFDNTIVAVKQDDDYSLIKSNRKITIRDLLTHTAGVGWGLGPGKKDWEKADIIGWDFADKDETIQQTVKRIAKLPMDAQPGDNFVYGLSTDILGALIEVVSKKPLNQFLQEEIFNPLNMKDTHFYLPIDIKDRLATVYSSTELGIVKSHYNHGFKRGVYFSSFYENGRDFLRGEIDDSELILKPKFVQGSEYINKWWKRKAIKRYTKLHTENRLKPEILYYSDILGMTWDECKEKYLGEVGR